MRLLTGLFEAVESDRFSATVNLASDFKMFLRLLSSEKAVADLAAAVRGPAERAALSERVHALANERGEEGYEHPRDAALAAYLWVLSGADPRVAEVGAGEVATTPGCWWAAKMADRISSSREPSAGGAPADLVKLPPPDSSRAGR
jgi:hypothetical protein